MRCRQDAQCVEESNAMSRKRIVARVLSGKSIGCFSVMNSERSESMAYMPASIIEPVRPGCPRNFAPGQPEAIPRSFHARTEIASAVHHQCGCVDGK